MRIRVSLEPQVAVDLVHPRANERTCVLDGVNAYQTQKSHQKKSREQDVASMAPSMIWARVL